MMSSDLLWRDWANLSSGQEEKRKAGELEGKLDWAHMSPAQYWSGSRGGALIAYRVAVAGFRASVRGPVDLPCKSASSST